LRKPRLYRSCSTEEEEEEEKEEEEVELHYFLSLYEGC
jgi:hypothetical protein